MFRVLIVEDQPDKLKHIIRLFEETPALTEAILEPVTDALSAKRKLEKRAYHLLILDISIPLSLSQDIDPQGGIKLLDEVISRDKYNVPVHIIGLTAHDDIFDQAKTKFSDITFSLIKYEVSSDNWKTQLIHGIQHQMNAMKDIQNFDEDYDYDVAFVCALSSELEAVRNNGWSWTQNNISNDDTIYYQAIVQNGECKIKVVAAHALRMGMPNSASLAMKIIARFRPKYLVMTGIMAGLNSKVNLGDLIFASPVWDWGSGKWTNENNGKDLTNLGNGKEGSSFAIDPFQYVLDTKVIREVSLLSENKEYFFKLRTSFRGNAPKYDIQVHIGPVASGASVLSDALTINKIREEQHRKLLGIEMEAYALFCASEYSPRPKPIAFSVKAVVDYGDKEKDDDFHEFGCYASAQVAKTIIEGLLF